MISNVQSSLRTAALFIGNDGAAVVDLVNRQVHGSSLVDRYATLFYGIFDRVTRTLRYVNAGHNPPMLIRADGSVSWLEAGGAPVGMFPDWSYTEGSVNLRPGDMLVAYTDGVVEAQNADGVEWGVEGLQAAAQAAHPRSAERMLQSLLGALDEFSDGCQADDVTLAVLRVL
jgi:sigma-B regulation protein RsbU (phosphoserine phosphatase)